MKYVVYDPDTGNILRTGACPDGELGNMAGAGELAIRDPRNGDTRDTRQAVEVIAGEPLVVDLPAAPEESAAIVSAP